MEMPLRPFRLKSMRKSTFNGKTSHQARGKILNPGKRFFLKLASEVVLLYFTVADYDLSSGICAHNVPSTHPIITTCLESRPPALRLRYRASSPV